MVSLLSNSLFLVRVKRYLSRSVVSFCFKVVVKKIIQPNQFFRTYYSVALLVRLLFANPFGEQRPTARSAILWVISFVETRKLAVILRLLYNEVTRFITPL